MTLNFKRAVVPAVVALLLFVGLAEWLLWLMPKPHGPLAYMVAGTGSTVAALGMLFTYLVRRKELWGTHRRS